VLRKRCCESIFVEMRVPSAEVGREMLESRRTVDGDQDFPGAARDLIDDLAKGNVSARPSKWSDLVIGTHKYRINASD
jgi:hypothetical protein